MNQLKPFLKKFLLVYAFAVFMVLIYFVLKTLFPNTKEIELKSFNTPKEVTSTFVQEDKENTEDIKEQNNEAGFILLPRK